MEGTRKRKRKRKETLSRPPRNVRKYLDRQSSNQCLQFSFGAVILRLQPWVPWAPKTVGKWPAPAHRKSCTFPNHSQALETENKKKERGKRKRSMIIIADCCREIIWLSTHLKCEDASLGQQRIRSLKSYTGNGPVSSL